ncbi:MAG: glycerol-3-phosphate dehydrogenase [Paraglaciecola psychrophila]|jgi:glycerol-3-phosphate dehydrogenase
MTQTAATGINTTDITTDIVVIGGGVAGLWLLNRLQRAGYSALLFERDELGGGQSIASQGMIHGGIKYALGGILTGASEAIADMPDHWRRCLDGSGDVDLSGVPVLSENFYIWSTQSIGSRLGSFFASKLSRGRVEAVADNARPAVFDSDQFTGNLYNLVDLVLDVPSVIAKLTSNCADSIFSIDWQHSQFQRAEDGAVSHLTINPPTGPALRIAARQFVFTAGEGNQQLLARLDKKQPAMQRRPLKQVLLKHALDLPLYAHCMGANPSPRLTVSSHRCNDGQWVWYLGGDLATEGVGSTDQVLIAKAKAELATLFTWLDFGDCQWATLTIDRAEPKQRGIVKPDRAFAAAAGDHVIAAWPTKLTLSPHLADEVIALLTTADIHPGTPHPDQTTALQQLPKPAIATPCWETLFSR